MIIEITGDKLYVDVDQNDNAIVEILKTVALIVDKLTATGASFGGVESLKDKQPTIKPTHRFRYDAINDDTDWFAFHKGAEVYVTNPDEEFYSGFFLSDGSPFTDVKRERLESV